MYIKNRGGVGCGIYSYGNNKQDIKCGSEFYGKNIESNLGLDGITPGWHVLRFEIEPETMTFSYIVDGRKVGAFVPKDSIPDHFDEFKQSDFHFKFALNNFGPSKAPVGYVDYVRVGAIGDDPLLLFFDDFSESELNELYKEFPANLSLNYQGEPNYSLETLDQSTVIRLQSNLQSNQSSGLQISKTFNTGTSPIRLEIRFNTLVQSATTSIDGFINVWLLKGDNSRADWFGLAAWNYGADRNFTGTPFGSVQFDFKDNTWYRLVVIGSGDQEIRASIIDDETAREIVGVGLGYNLSMYKSGFKIGIMQQMGTPTPATYFPTDVAIDWIRLTIAPNR